MSSSLLIRSKAKGPIHLRDSEYGLFIARAAGSLDRISETIGIASIDFFTYMEPGILQEMIEMAPESKRDRLKTRLNTQREWHGAADGLATIQRLKQHVQQSSEDIEIRLPGSPEAMREALLQDLNTVENILQTLSNQNDMFRFEAA